MKPNSDVKVRILFLALFLALVLVTACSNQSGGGSSDAASTADFSENPNGPFPEEAPPEEVVQPTPSEPNPNVPPPTSPPVVSENNVPPLWEAARSDSAGWTTFSYDVVKTYGASLMTGTTDMSNFCPNYFNLSDNLKRNFWVNLISAMVKYESSFNPTTRYVETTMGTDPITGSQVASEGLLQLSYQDSQSYSFCNEFNWEVDKNLSVNSPQKTIFDPYKNLKCGIRILNRIVYNKKMISFSTGHYWYVLKPVSTALPKIKTYTNSLPFCKL